jgi:hypothetical protein
MLTSTPSEMASSRTAYILPCGSGKQSQLTRPGHGRSANGAEKGTTAKVVLVRLREPSCSQPSAYLFIVLWVVEVFHPSTIAFRVCF